MSHLSLTGNQLAAMSPIYRHQLVTVLDNSNPGFTKDQTYIRNADNTIWRGISGGKHLHNDTTEASGGPLTDIIIANQPKLLWYNEPGEIDRFAGETASGGGTTSDTPNGRIALNTNNTQFAWDHYSLGGLGLSFAFASQFMFKGYVNANTQVSTKIGVGAENVNDVHDNNRKYCIEACDSAGTARNWDLATATGSTRVAEATTENVLQSVPRGYKLLYTPGQDCKFYVDGVLKNTKTSAMVASGGTIGARNVSFGIKANAASTPRTMYVYHVSLAGVVADSNWV